MEIPSRVLKAAVFHSSVSIRRPRYSTGWWAWLLQRVTGVLLVAYLLLHIGVISSVQAGAHAFDRVLGFVQKPVFAYLDIALIAIVIYHGANGVRVTLLDMGIGVRRQAAMAWAAGLVTVLGTVFAAYMGRPLLFR
ncbi:MAG: succinate dehydrogenase, cytochrome b556 subunit [Chloroflexi bacterium]|nr:succinate dehydrogenase, cytochrome b556 subunit [Chloroflexota bacterium]